MCGILAGKILDENYFSFYEKKIKNIFINSMIRGKHASGFSYFKDGKNETFNFPESADLFIKNENFNGFLENVKANFFIGHVRYSTSDILYNQPISIKKNFSLSHNGVITQREYQYWKDDYNLLLQDYNLKTKNDTELLGLYLYKFLNKQIEENPFSYFKESSIASVVLYKNKIYFLRNGKRPLYYYLSDKYFFIASTKDIFIRSNMSEKYIKEVKPFIIYKFDGLKIKIFFKDEIKRRDWQHE